MKCETMNISQKVVSELVLIILLFAQSHEATIRHRRYKTSLFPSNSSLFTSKSHHHKHNLRNIHPFSHLTTHKKEAHDSDGKSGGRVSTIRKIYGLTAPKIKSYKEFYEKYYQVKPTIQEIKPKFVLSDRGRLNTNYSLFEDLTYVKRANEHLLKIRREAKCEKPKAKVINIQELIPDRRKEYVPRCTILYRCDGETGCCNSEKFQCVAKSWHYVRLYFYTLTVKVDPEMESSKTENKIESYLFQNHTECRCEDAYDIPRVALDRTTPSVITQPPTIDNMATVSVSDSLQIHIKTPQMVEPPSNFEQNPKNESIGTSRLIAPSLRLSRCRDCPIPFNKRPFYHGGCSCDCFDKQRNCLKIKRGKVPLDDTERRCVEAKYCHEPECEHGSYITEHGRCPKRSERKTKRKHSYKHSTGRWKAHERD